MIPDKTWPTSCRHIAYRLMLFGCDGGGIKLLVRSSTISASKLFVTAKINYQHSLLTHGANSFVGGSSPAEKYDFRVKRNSPFFYATILWASKKSSS
ncbi:hypothetical protein DRB05_09435 [Pseudoalteromonas sp. A757]|nr:hypothetical protein DRB05_09435 [Pseudoalteromonas sp. A757]